MKINEEKSQSLIASNKSIIFDAGQIFVAKFFDNLLIKFAKFQTENFISKIFTKNNTKEIKGLYLYGGVGRGCLLYTSPSPRDNRVSRMPSSA